MNVKSMCFYALPSGHVAVNLSMLLGYSQIRWEKMQNVKAIICSVPSLYREGGMEASSTWCEGDV